MGYREKLNQIFTLQKAGTVLQSSWLRQQGYSHGLQQRYRSSKWLLLIGLRTTKLTLFGGRSEKLPTWFRNYDWEVKIDFYSSSFLDPSIGLTNMEVRGLNLAVSTPARALMECLYLARHDQELMECYKLMEGLNDLHSEEAQALLESCRSVKVKRLFLYMADKAAHEWIEYIDPTNIDLGKGKRSIVRNGVYVDGYGITVPKELEEQGRSL